MRYALLFVLGIALLAVGCTGSQPATTAPATTCADYCPSLQHANCAGSWDASGTYPSCTCTFNCVPANPPNQSPSVPPANVTPPPQNVSPPANQTPPAANATPQLPITNKSIETLLNDALSTARDDFYNNNDGSFQESKYTWVRTPASTAPGELLVTAPATLVKFNGAAIPSMAATGFIAFTNVNTGASSAYGAAIFRADSTPLDTIGDGFSVNYSDPQIGKNLRYCGIYDTAQQAGTDGKSILTYYFSCGKAVDK